ncbi:MAG: hypothetical protein ACI91O_001677 [Candidatus Poriferisodalaceae bacterium]|jgi:hypothetical protein
MNEWLVAAIVLRGTLVLGSVVSRVARSALSSARRPAMVQSLAATAVEQAISRGTGKSAGAIPVVLKTVILTLAVILAASQLGIDTTIITIAVSSVFFSVGLGAALMVGLGGRGVAAARALRYVLNSGDVV